MSVPRSTRPSIDDEDAAFVGSVAPRTQARPDPAPIETPAFEFDYKPVQIEVSPYNKGNAELQARRQQAINKRLETKPGAFPMPGGRIGVAEYVQPHYAEKRNWWLAEPEKLLKDPKPAESGYRYAWPRSKDQAGKNDPETRGWIRGGMYRPVRFSELKPDLASGVTTHRGPGQSEADAFVEWRDLILVEVRPEMVRQQYDEPQHQAIRRVAGEKESLAADIEQMSGGNAQLTQFEAINAARE